MPCASIRRCVAAHLLEVEVRTFNLQDVFSGPSFLIMLNDLPYDVFDTVMLNWFTRAVNCWLPRLWDCERNLETIFFSPVNFFQPSTLTLHCTFAVLW